MTLHFYQLLRPGGHLVDLQTASIRSKSAEHGLQALLHAAPTGASVYVEVFFVQPSGRHCRSQTCTLCISAIIKHTHPFVGAFVTSGVDLQYPTLEEALKEIRLRKVVPEVLKNGDENLTPRNTEPGATVWSEWRDL